MGGSAGDLRTSDGEADFDSGERGYCLDVAGDAGCKVPIGMYSGTGEIAGKRGGDARLSRGRECKVRAGASVRRLTADTCSPSSSTESLERDLGADSEVLVSGRVRRPDGAVDGVNDKDDGRGLNRWTHRTMTTMTMGRLMKRMVATRMGSCTGAR